MNKTQLYLVASAVAVGLIAAPPINNQLTTEYKLVDALIAADRAVEQAVFTNAAASVLAAADTASDTAGAKLTTYCASIGKAVGVKTYGVVGCVPATAAWPVKP